MVRDIGCTNYVSKLSRGYGKEDVPPHKRFKANVGDLFLSNDISGIRAQSLCADALDAGASASCLKRMAKAGVSGKRPGNIARDIGRQLKAKRTKWPPLYWAHVRVWDPKTQAEKLHLMPIYLPHELVRAVCEKGSKDKLLATGGMCAETLDHMADVKAKIGCDDVLGCGLWGDSMPFNWDRSESVFAFSMNFPGLGDEYKNLRLPLFAINKKFMAKGGKTIDDVCEVLRWSFVCMATGQMPTARHDGSPWGEGIRVGRKSSDHRRKKQAQSSIGVKGVLAEIRGSRRGSICP